MTIEELKKEIENLSPQQQVEKLTAFIAENPDCDEAYLTRGILYWSLDARGKAMTDYIAAIRLNPDSKAKTLMETANQILNFFNKDLYNP